MMHHYSRFTLHILSSLLAIMAFAAPTHAASYQVKGVVTDSIGEPEAYATIHIYHLPDTVKTVANLVTKDNGSFSRTLKAPGDYRLTVFIVGRDLLAKDFTISEAQPVANLGTLVTSSEGNVLDEVEVVAQKPIVTTEIDRLGYDVTADDDAKVAMTDEILRKVPLVEVDEEGNIKISGSSNFKVYKNGKPDKSFTNNAKDIFKALPAAMIQKIEVITDPGAREDMEGVDAILNIITVPNTIMKGVVGNLNLGVNNYGVVYPGTYLTTQLDKVTAEVYGGMTIRNIHSSGSYSEAWQDYYESEQRLETSSSSRSKGLGGYWGLSSSYEMDTLNLFNLDFGGYASRNHSYSNGSHLMFSSRADAIDPVIYSYNTIGTTSPSTYHDINLGLSYQRSTRRKGEYILLAYRLSTSVSRSDATTEYTDTFNMPVPYAGIISDSKTIYTEQTGQLDWSRPLGKGQTLEMGGKYINRRNHNKANQDYLDYRQTFTDFEHVTQIAALYADYRANLAKWGFRAGLRYEYTHLNADYKSGDGTSFSSNLNDWAPNATISYKLSQTGTLKLSGSSSIRRPGIWYLNPTRYETPTSVSYGNPDLESERITQFTLGYSIYTPSGINFTINSWYSWADNNIIPVQWAEGDVTYSTYANDGKDRTWRTQFNFSTFLNKSKKTHINFGASWAWNSHENPSYGLYRQDWSGRFNLSIRQNLPYKWRIRGFMYWNTPNDRGLYSRVHYRHGASIGYYSISLIRGFLKDERLWFSVSWNNPFASKKRCTVTETVNMPYDGESYSYSRHPQYANINISYRFGKLNAQVKKVKGSIDNNDVVGGVSRGE